MGFFKSIARRADLVGRMADTVGIDAATAAGAEEIAAQAWRNAVVRCSGCTHDAECRAFMDAADAAGEHPKAPSYCRNKAMLDGM